MEEVLLHPDQCHQLVVGQNQGENQVLQNQYIMLSCVKILKVYHDLTFHSKFYEISVLYKSYYMNLNVASCIKDNTNTKHLLSINKSILS